MEIIAVMDGYWQEVQDDPRVRVLHLGRNRGMREAINAGVKISRGEFIQRSDEHCKFGQGFDRILTETCQDNWIVTARRFALDPIKWEIMPEVLPVDYERLIIQQHKKFAGFPWRTRDKERADYMIDETMAMQGSMWVMSRKWWDEAIGELQTEGYGPHYQDSHEMIFKTWQKGGKMMVNKWTWFAHKHYSFPRTHHEGSPENPSKRNESWQYCLDTWMDYFENVVRPAWKI